MQYAWKEEQACCTKCGENYPDTNHVSWTDDGGASCICWDLNTSKSKTKSGTNVGKCEQASKRRKKRSQDKGEKLFNQFVGKTNSFRKTKKSIEKRKEISNYYDHHHYWNYYCNYYCYHYCNDYRYHYCNYYCYYYCNHH